MNILRDTPRPAKISFVPSPDKQLDFAAPPSRFILSRIEDFMMITAFEDPPASSAAEVDANAGPVLAVDHTTKAVVAVQPGLVIMQINGAKVAADATVEQVQSMLVAAPEPPQPTKVAVRCAFVDMMENCHILNCTYVCVYLQVRDMDAFMHLIRIRDGKENLAESCTEE
jgi:hypothetical protein